MLIPNSIAKSVKAQIKGTLVEYKGEMFSINEVTKDGIVVNTEEIPGYTTMLIKWDNIQ